MRIMSSVASCRRQGSAQRSNKRLLMASVPDELRLGIPRHAKSYRSAKAWQDRLFEYGGLIGEGEAVRRFLPCRGVSAVQRLDGSNSTAQQKRVLIRQGVAGRSDFARKRQMPAKTACLSKAAPIPKRREIDSNERQSREVGRQNLCRLVDRQGDAEKQVRCRSNGLVLLQARQAQNTGARRQRCVVRQGLPGITHDPTTFKQRHRQPP